MKEDKLMYLHIYIKQNKPLKVKRGSRTKVYIFNDKALLRTIDPVKECMALGWFPDHELFPEVKRTDFEDLDDSFQVFESPVYLQGSSMKQLVCKEAWEEVYLPLRRMFLTMSWGFRSHEWKFSFLNAINNCVGLREEVKEPIKEAYEACMNFSESEKVKFEISPRNIAATEDGKLILLDCFFMV
jgi:hypothetical protein